jgi:hypothetical protein
MSPGVKVLLHTRILCAASITTVTWPVALVSASGERAHQCPGAPSRHVAYLNRYSIFT